MARDTGGGQQRKQPRRDEDTEHNESSEVSEEFKERQDELADDVDSMLDEIDEVLEENAEDFVRGFVQKGGQ